jgi:hypothetical protein
MYPTLLHNTGILSQSLEKQRQPLTLDIFKQEKIKVKD